MAAFIFGALALLLAAAWLWSPWAPQALRPLRMAVVAAVGFVLLSVSTLRGVHHWGGVAWEPGLLSSSLAQTSLTVVWSVLGVIGWITGSRRGRRGLWLAGALLNRVTTPKVRTTKTGDQIAASHGSVIAAAK